MKKPIKNIVVCGKAPDLSVDFSLDQEKIISINLLPHRGFVYQITGNSAPSLENLIQKWMGDYAQGRIAKVVLPLEWQNLPPYTSLVLKALQKVSFGDVVSYQELAEITGNPRAARAVGNACARNPFPLVIPCHRVIAGDGSLGGFSGGLEIKQSLLNFESHPREIDR